MKSILKQIFLLLFSINSIIGKSEINVESLVESAKEELLQQMNAKTAAPTNTPHKTVETNDNSIDIEIANLIYLIYCDPLVIKFIEEFMSARADIATINNTLKWLTTNILTQAKKFGLGVEKRELVQTVMFSLTSLNNHFETQIRGIIDAASATQTLKDYYLSKFYSPFTLSYFITQMMFMPNKYFKNNYFKKIVRARNEATKILANDQQTLDRIKALLQEIKEINSDITKYYMSVFHKHYNHFKAEEHIKETNTQTYLHNFWNSTVKDVASQKFLEEALMFGIAQSVRKDLGVSGIFKSIGAGITSTIEGVIHQKTFNILPLLGFNDFLTKRFTDYRAQTNILIEQGELKPSDEQKSLTRKEAEPIIQARLAGVKSKDFKIQKALFKEGSKKFETELKEYDKAKSEEAQEAYIAKLDDDKKKEFTNLLRLRPLVDFEKKHIQRAPLLSTFGKMIDADKGEVRDVVASLMYDKSDEDLYKNAYNELSEKKRTRVYGQTTTQIAFSKSSLYKTVTSDIPYFVSGMWNLVGDFIKGKKYDANDHYSRDIQVAKLFFAMPIFKTTMNLYSAFQSVNQMIENSQVVEAYKHYTNCLVRKIKCVTELMLLYQKVLSSKLTVELPEFTYLKKLLANKNNKEKIKELKIAADRSLVTWMAINQVIPIFVYQQYQNLIVDYFEVNNSEEFVKEYGNSQALSLFFKVIENFISLFDIIVTNITILQRSRGEFSMPELVDYKGSADSLVFDIKDMFVPGSQFKSNNSISLGGSNEQRNIMITAPIGSGKTFIIKNMLLVLYLANVGVVPAKKARLTLFDDCSQSNSIIYTEKRGGISKNMGERMFVDDTLKKVTEIPGAYFVLLDEFFGGTQVEQALKLAELKIVPLWRKGNVIGVYTTHFGPMIELIKKHPELIMKGYIGVTELPSGAFKKTYTLKANKNYNDPDDWWFNTDAASLARKARYGEWSGGQEEKIMHSILAGGSNYR